MHIGLESRMGLKQVQNTMLRVLLSTLYSQLYIPYPIPIPVDLRSRPVRI